MNAELANVTTSGLSRTARQDLAAVAPALWECDICGVSMLDLHCKLRCVNCGFMRDCSDP